MPESRPPSSRGSEDREIDYLICKQCNSPCYIFEMDGSRISEAQCLVCGNDGALMFMIGEEMGNRDDES